MLFDPARLRTLADRAFVQVGSTGGFTLGLCLDADENAYTCDIDETGR